MNAAALLAAGPGPDALWWLLLVWITAVGGCVGSFLNVVIYRWPRGMSLVRPGSRCPQCGRPIRWYHNLPVLGWLLLAGRCKDCGQPISARYPLVEGAVAMAFAALAVTGPLSMRAAVDDAALAAPANPWPELTLLPWLVFLHHALLVCLLLVLVLIQQDGKLTARHGLTLLAGGLATAVVRGLFWPSVQPALALAAVEPINGIAPGRPAMLLATLLGTLCGAALGWLSARGSGERFTPEDTPRTAQTGMSVPPAAPVTEHDAAGHDFRIAGAAAGALVGGYLGWQAACVITIVATAFYVLVVAIIMLFLRRRPPHWPAGLLPATLAWIFTAHALHARWPQTGAAASWTLLAAALAAAGLSCLAGWAYRRGRLH
ncbi:MAG: prepilin peptidase [Pirellulales bacterium]